MNYVFIRHLFTFTFSLLIAIYILPMLIKAAFRFNVLDLPDGKIKKHKKPTPYLGGLAIYIPFIASLSIAYPFENKILWLLLGVTFLLFVGLVDDLKILRPAQKFFGQFLAVLCFLKGGFSLKTQFFSDIFNVFASGFWMLFVINAFNLVDVADGLATILALTSSFTFFVIAILFKQYAVSVLMAAFIAPLIVFFFYNKPPAKIYLGDAGSLFLGGFLAAVPMLFNWSGQFYFAYYTPIIILGVPLLEVASLIVIRTFKGIPFYKGSPHHFAIYLKKKGWSSKKILVFSFLMSSVLSLLALLFLFKFINFLILILLLLALLVFWFLFVFL